MRCDRAKAGLKANEELRLSSLIGTEKAAFRWRRYAAKLRPRVRHTTVGDIAAPDESRDPQVDRSRDLEADVVATSRVKTSATNMIDM